MTREEAKELLPILQAFAEGKTIQFKTKDRPWFDLLDNDLEIRGVFKYRIKPEPKYRPFKTQEECWEEMHKHPDFGFIREKGTKAIYSISMIGNLYLSTRESEKLGDTLYVYEFMDGEPFGIREE